MLIRAPIRRSSGEGKQVGSAMIYNSGDSVILIINFFPAKDIIYSYQTMKVKIVKAQVGTQKVNCHLAPGFDRPLICTDKILKKLGGKIVRRITSDKKDSKFIREVATILLGWTVIPLTFVSDNSTKKSITILTKVLVDKHKSTLPNYILLGQKWFRGFNMVDDITPSYLPIIVTMIVGKNG
ncbi:hypothetical protein Glove_441g98 [Diversispora epigaea]|uniref:Uncharacterized protein n=1 Tax=Diversispora epigaea TaxID=1348612 RepID=A0A397GVC2_9GLOM|nr:hypothetical protein Glove_441g98 [Diversispora epigaea]